MSFWWEVGKAVWAAVKWVAVWVAKVAAWAAANPAAAIAVAIAAKVAASWLTSQSWWGAQALGEILNSFADVTITIALMSWVSSLIIAAGKGAIAAAFEWVVEAWKMFAAGAAGRGYGSPTPGILSVVR